MLYFVRHGATDWNDHKNAQGEKDSKCQGRADVELNERGITQAYETKELLKDVLFDKVFSSPLKRALKTCEIICGGKYNIVIDERLIERDLGEFEGLTRSEFDFADFWNGNSTKEYVKAETIAQVKKRVFSFLEELKKEPTKNILLVSHGGIGCILTSYFNGEPEEANYLKYGISNCKVVTYNFNNINKN